MNEGREFDLLVDLSRLLKKYGPEVFDRLAKQLSAPIRRTAHEAALRGGTNYARGSREPTQLTAEAALPKRSPILASCTQ